MDVFLNTALLSHNMSVGTSIGTTKLRSLYRNKITNWTASLHVVNSDSKIDVTTEFYSLLRHITVAWLQNINRHVCDSLVNFSDR